MLGKLTAAFCLLLLSPQNVLGISSSHWVDTWVSMPQLTELTNLPPPPFNSTLIFQNSTIRQTLHMSLGADEIRVTFSNAFGIDDLSITAATIALPTNGSAGVSSIDPKTLKTLTFSGTTNFTIPDGALVVSDPVQFKILPQSMLTVTLYLADGQGDEAITSHPGSRTTSWMTLGNFVSAPTLDGLDSTTSVAHWYFVSAVEAWVPKTSSSFIIVGDSITDGRGSDTDGNDRWPDLLLARMQKTPSTAGIAVLNQAAGGNRVLNDILGPNALGRIDRDVLSHAGVKYAMIFEGVNDIGTATTDPSDQANTGARLISAYKQIIRRVHKFGIPIFAATITPFSAPGGAAQQPYSDPNREVTRQTVNKWIRTSGEFDAVIDFDKILRDPAVPSQLAEQFNSGDFLHPNVLGYQTIANDFPLEIFEQFAGGVDTFQ